MTPDGNANRRDAVKQPGLWVLLLLTVLGVVGLVALMRTDSGPPARNTLPPSFDYDLSSLAKVDPKWIGYEPTAWFPVAMRVVRGVALGPDGLICVAGDRAIHVLEPDDGRLRRKIALDEAPRCLAADGDLFYVGFENHVAVVDLDGTVSAQWDSRGPDALLTSIAVSQDDVFVADAGTKCVLRYDKSGKMTATLARRDARRNVPALVIPSPYCDVAVGSDGLLRVVNPGRHRIEYFTRRGDYEAPLTWGQSGLAIERFCGCCNPVAIALLADNRVVTAEKGIPRVKVYSAEGRFECVVASPEQLTSTDTMTEETRTAHKLLAVDLAVDRQGRILVLDPAARGVRVFVKKKPHAADDSESGEVNDE
ncbi:MAG: hypothetical protein JW888_15585 [Pirellulales bacterium]|nr:hypothetical protein [Pirellulales bacterium]